MAAALLVMTMMMTGCSSEDDDILGQDSSAQPKETAGVRVTVSAGISDGDGTTRSTVEMDGTKRVLKFTKGDRLYVRKEVSGASEVKYVAGMLTMVGDPSADGKSATFTGNVAAYNDRRKEVSYNLGADPLEGTEATLVHEGMVERKNYLIATTDGTMNLIQHYAANVEELMTKGLTVKGSYTSGSGYALAASKPIIYCSLSGLEGDKNYKVQLQKPVSGGVSPKGFGVFTTDASGAGTVAIEATGSGVNEWEIEIKQDNTTVGIISLGNRELAAKVYNVTRYWTGSEFVKAEPKEIPLTMQALTDGTIVVDMPRSGMQYSKNGGEKTTMSSTTTINVSAGDKVQLYGNGTNITSYYKASNDMTTIGGSAGAKVYGNIMSLVDETGFATATKLTRNSAFMSFFQDYSNLTDASGLLLPATKLAVSCYKSMFRGCTSLTAAPALPAETLADNCYDRMFYGCTSLTAAPALPAEMLADNCYDRMFYGCTSLTAAPALPAETLAQYCYGYMFYGCTSLTTAPELPAETLDTYCYTNMFNGCTSLTTAPELPAKTLADYCYAQMFYDCTSLTAAPVLPAPTLAMNCYNYMFSGCTNLNSVTSLATAINSNNTRYWLQSVAATGTFTRAKNARWTTGTSGIPDGWTVVNAK